MAKHRITQEECPEKIKGVCEGCGGKLEPMETVNLLRKLERSNDAWINEREANIAYKKSLNDAIETIGKEAAQRILTEEENTALKIRLSPIADVWGRWKDFARTTYPTVEHVHQALYDFGKAIEKSMEGYNPKEEEMTKILFCTCEHEYQDKQYGKHMRVHNSKKPKDGMNRPTDFRCTVCGSIKGA